MIIKKRVANSMTIPIKIINDSDISLSACADGELKEMVGRIRCLSLPITHLVVPLEYDKWFELNENELGIAFAESGADRELDFDYERECEKGYEKYLKSIPVVKDDLPFEKKSF